MRHRLYLSAAPAVPEGFKLIDGFEFYCVDATGRVLSCRTRGAKIVPWRAMTVLMDKPKHGRLFVGLRTGGKFSSKYVHRLVLEAFVGPCPLGMEACHNDGNPLNNNVENLRWDTHLKNMEARSSHGRTSIGMRHPSAKLTDDDVRAIRKLYLEGMQQIQIAPLYGVTNVCIHQICTGKTWTSII